MTENDIKSLLIRLECLADNPWSIDALVWRASAEESLRAIKYLQNTLDEYMEANPDPGYGRSE